MRNLLLAIFTSTLCFNVFGQTKPLEVTYFREVIISEKYKSIENPVIRDKVIEQLKQQNYEFAMYFNKGIYGFAKKDIAYSKNKFMVSGDMSEYFDLKKKEKFSQEEILGKNFTVKDSLKPINWTIGNDTKEILGKTCIKATASSDENADITVWFCNEIPVGVGPCGYYGLPGLIMEAETSFEKFTVRSVEFTKNKLTIVPPNRGTVVSRDEFTRIKDKKLKEIGADPSNSNNGIQIITL